MGRLVSARQQQHDDLLELRVIYTVSGALVDSYFRNAIARIFVIAEITITLDARNSSLDCNQGASISNSIEPTLERVLAVGRKAVLNLQGLW